MNLRQLEVFYAIMQTGTVSGAAKNLHVSQPNVTRVLAHTELQLGFSLFERVKGRLVPTQEARTLLPEVEKIYLQLGQFKTLTNKVKKGHQHVRIGAPPVLATKFLTPVIAQFHQAHQCSIELVTGNRSELCDALLDNALDIAVAFGEDTPAGISHQLLAKKSMQVLVPTSGFTRLSEGENTPPVVTLEALLDDELNIIALDRRDPLGQKLTLALEQIQPDFVPSLTVRNYSSGAELAALGAGIAIVDPWTASQYAASENLHSLQLSDVIDCSVSLLTSDLHPFSIATRSFLSMLKNHASA
ncbi:LysR family transcriptional regulator [Vibrio sp. ER1A]|uniref:LysR family transcriptional regulator n=1 Tax=Vibrio sp. ER1A TaxID=1517681 RepID=UPI0004DCB98F|nr:LysR family transcriptional regulator [Vibrio sp. ER1A]KFA95905.1 LysR family transcriptional regulator [Vibrio sp. ER1A]